jgi:spermidine synthase
VELDPVVAELARTRGFARGAIHVGDGRTFWRRSRSRYDFVVLDAFQGESLPEHLLSAEALRELRERLHPGGILVLHVIAHAEGTAAAALWRTLGAAFEERLALRTPRSDSLQDLFFFASEKPLAPPPHPELAATPLAEARYEPPSHGVLLHDDRNPLGLLHRHEARVLRLASMRDARRSTSSAPAGGSSAR